ncbi:hypothetical protein [Niveibacterium microcysteis]|uniref:Uncharacterized protein n=1 Tax=Niveibacterium microcysteis TaxID=2811415 RepID=A0ABX7M7A4_9RHOO|nr:hypothetical protein [Niveibacterium microcysteis]QSI75347.1 hypothetical protein JY500_12575 [Niveibacterium microcysteis]
MASAGESPQTGSASQELAPYAASCGGKSECGVTDQLEIKPLGAAKALQSVCIHFTGVSCTAQEAIPVYNPDPAHPVSAMIPLSPLVERWLKRHEQVLRDSPRASLPVNLDLTDADRKAFTIGFSLNISALWSNGALPLRITSANCQPNNVCRLGRDLTLQVPQLTTWALATKSDPAKLSLILGNTKMPGVARSPGQGTLSFRLERLPNEADSMRAWNAVMSQVLADDQHSIRVSVADDKGTLAQSDRNAHFEVSSYRLVWSLLITAIAVCLVALPSRHFGWVFVRDSYTLPEDVIARREMPYSLGRSQMLFWTVVVILASSLVGLSTGDWLSFNESTLILVGIGTGTVLGSVSTGMPPVLEKLVEDFRAAVSANPPDTAAIGAARQALRNELCSSGNWFADVLSDYGDDKGLHRIQSLLFTVLIGGFFVVQSYLHGAMPDLSPNVLALLGISGGAYVGFKLAGQ